MAHKERAAADPLKRNGGEITPPAAKVLAGSVIRLHSIKPFFLHQMEVHGSHHAGSRASGADSRQARDVDEGQEQAGSLLELILEAERAGHGELQGVPRWDDAGDRIQPRGGRAKFSSAEILLGHSKRAAGGVAGNE